MCCNCIVIDLIYILSRVPCVHTCVMSACVMHIYSIFHYRVSVQQSRAYLILNTFMITCTHTIHCVIILQCNMSCYHAIISLRFINLFDNHGLVAAHASVFSVFYYVFYQLYMELRPLTAFTQASRPTEYSAGVTVALLFQQQANIRVSGYTWQCQVNSAVPTNEMGF